jgi:hypothetical protein
MLCKYKDIFGKVGTGVHSYRIFNIAIIDVIFTFIGAFIIHLFVPKFKFIYILGFLFILGIILHNIFCVDTTVNKFINNLINKIL